MLFPYSPRPGTPARVVVTGAGMITALGTGWRKNAEGFREGRRAFRPVRLFDVTRQRVKIAAEVDLPAELPRSQLTRRHTQRLERASCMLLHAACEAWEASGWEPAEDLPVILGTTSGGMTLGEAYFRQAVQHPQDPCGQPTRVIHYQAQEQALMLGRALGFRGPVTIIANACASGANAVGQAYECIRAGRAERVLAGGYDALSHLVFSGFDALQALSPTTCRPFDAHRDGLALGEGAAVFCLESLASAQARQAHILGEISGYGAATDIHHLTQPHPQGRAAWRSMQAACEQARVTPDQIGYVNAHGTGTPLNDAAEAAALAQWAGAAAAKIPLSSTKASIGHLLGAAGAVEVGVCLMALQEGWLPPETSVEVPDPQCPLPLVRASREARFEFALTNSFGFGGANASLVLRRSA